MTADELRRLWHAAGERPRQPGELTGRAVPGVDGIWAAVDAEGRHHLLVRVPEDREDRAFVETRGLHVAVATHRVEGGEPATFVDLICVDESVLDTFVAVSADIAGNCEGVSPEGRPSAVAAALARWQWFWGIERSELGPEGALGLFGELWFLRRWLGPSAQSVSAWTADTGARHDFQWREASVEVKTAALRSRSAIHRIHGLEQLGEPETGTLFLFSLHVARDELAVNSLPALAKQIEDDLASGPDTQREFRQRLGNRGYNPAHATQHSTPYRVVAEAIYCVRPDFPRLVGSTFPDGLPSAVSDVTYALDMSACEPWLVAREPSAWRPPGGPLTGR